MCSLWTHTACMINLKLFQLVVSRCLALTCNFVNLWSVSAIQLKCSKKSIYWTTVTLYLCVILSVQTWSVYVQLPSKRKATLSLLIAAWIGMRQLNPSWLNALVLYQSRLHTRLIWFEWTCIGDALWRCNYFLPLPGEKPFWFEFALLYAGCTPRP